MVVREASPPTPTPWSAARAGDREAVLKWFHASATPIPIRRPDPREDARSRWGSRVPRADRRLSSASAASPCPQWGAIRRQVIPELRDDLLEFDGGYSITAERP